VADERSSRSSTQKPRIYFHDGRWHADVGLMTGWAGGSLQDRAFRFVWNLNFGALSTDDIPF
jgi:hypothetical protein